MGKHPRSRALLAAAGILATCPTAHAQTFDKLVDFACGSAVGCAPNGQLIQATDGRLYGTTSEGGTADAGVVFRLTLEGDIAPIAEPARGFFQATDGFFYGTTGDGGAYDAGTIFRMTTSGLITELYAFDPVSATGPGPMVQGKDGAFYGIVGIPESDLVRLFHMDQFGNVELRRSADPRVRNVRMILSARNGLLYGTTYGGVIFRMTRQGQSRALASFPTVYLDMIQASDGSFYGTTIDGGTAGAGIVFRMSPAGKVSVLHDFDGGAGGANPYEAPIEGPDGYLYGTTGMGGEHGLGTVYRMSRSGAFAILHSFSTDEGVYPVGEIVYGTDGAIYGTAVFGGANNQGTAWRLRLPTPSAAPEADRRGRPRAPGSGSR